ncbi:ankyrin repeat protein, putative [Trichomonas vaginalis G3]|uniref:Ankyrin repeat protein, putative n=1 Tax=Trichomonas vaginalis (strain ATCC PRA-98 / G3) TaxID=412133 RepID=A2GKK5_TRIV3|nr:ankyrin repeat and sterile alpha motif-containing protein [Trichomonas vaginalis G3]EAX82310.1 ankyrin repeat protein, putative [Trichomonas vaginalis G3]KAI5505468.1 ankyrin repeat and sterile alpha motif-containing protein [Trichomonas vaginalis G3]|eukprot:XP_001295240.1 ankyrin repeat protein [Trichomonas vaginalis G3]
MLHYAAIYFCDVDFDLINFSLSSLVNMQDNEEKTALHYAAINGNTNFVKWLTGRADFEISDNEGKIPLHYATISGNVKTA